jgi:hypothetical protein
MKIIEFTIRQVVFEIRFEEAYEVWDRAGQINREFSELWPKIQLSEAEPNKQILKSDEVQLHTGLRSCNIALLFPKTIAPNPANERRVSETFRVWRNALGFSKLTRVGTRVIMAKSFSSGNDAEQAIMSLGLTKTPKPPIFNHDTDPAWVDVRLHWQDEATSTQVRVHPEHHETEIKDPAGDPAKREKRTTYSVVIDMDRATRGSTDTGKFDVVQWLKGVQHLVNRDLTRLIET